MSEDNEELDRQFRVAKQMVGMHAIMRDGFARRARVVDLLLMACSVIFCATTFAGNDLYQFFRVSPGGARIVLGIASVLALIASIVALVVDWRECCGDHTEAFRKWSAVVELFRRSQINGIWVADKCQELQSAFWKASHDSTTIPDARFIGLKARYLLKVEMSKMASSFPGCPRWVLAVILRATGTANALRALVIVQQRKADREKDHGRATGHGKSS